VNGVGLLAPWGVALGAVVAGALLLLHAITVGRPRPAWLPTARFAPDRAPRVVQRLGRMADRWLLALRVLAVLLAGVALARPVREPERRRIARVVLADMSDRSVRAAVGDSVRALVGSGDAVVAFAAVPRAALLVPAGRPSLAADSAAPRGALDSTLAAAAPDSVADAPASLSAALVAARRSAPLVAAGADSVELVIISPFARDAVDAASAAVRGTWAGRARLVRVSASSAAARDSGTAAASRGARARPMRARSTVALRGGPADDALAAALALAGVGRDDASPVRVVRAAPTDADRTWATAPGHVLVVWPARGAAAGAGNAGAVVAGGRVAVGPFGRDTGAWLSRPGVGARAVARWADGTPAAVERWTGGGCVRTVGVRVPQTGDAALRPGFGALLPTLLGACGPRRDRTPLAPADLARLAGTGPLLAAAPLRVPRSTYAPDPLGAALLALAAALLVLELPLRRMLGRRADQDGERGQAAAPVEIGGPPRTPQAEAA